MRKNDGSAIAAWPEQPGELAENRVRLRCGGDLAAAGAFRHAYQLHTSYPSTPRENMKTAKQLFASLLLATSAAAPALAAPETFIVDTTHSFPRFSYSHFGYSTQLSRFNKTTGKVTFDKAAKTGSVDIVIDTKSVDTGFSTFDEHIQGEDFLDTAKFPTATFKSTKVNFNGDTPSTVEGNLTIKGVTKPVTLTVSSFQAMAHPMLKKDAIGANAYTLIKRSDFNAGKFAPHVGDDVRIDIAVEAIKE
jgi:polyisoprenoid-binding protein YceI